EIDRRFRLEFRSSRLGDYIRLGDLDFGGGTMRNSARLFPLALVFALVVCGLAQQTGGQSETAIRGWLSDEACARGRAESGTFTATNPTSAKECVAKGKKF